MKADRKDIIEALRAKNKKVQQKNHKKNYIF